MSFNPLSVENLNDLSSLGICRGDSRAFGVEYKYIVHLLKSLRSREQLIC